MNGQLLTMEKGMIMSCFSNDTLWSGFKFSLQTPLSSTSLGSENTAISTFSIHSKRQILLSVELFCHSTNTMAGPGPHAIPQTPHPIQLRYVRFLCPTNGWSFADTCSTDISMVQMDGYRIRRIHVVLRML